jgi:hypothetical protein
MSQPRQCLSALGHLGEGGHLSLVHRKIFLSGSQAISWATQALPRYAHAWQQAWNFLKENGYCHMYITEESAPQYKFLHFAIQLLLLTTC